MRDICVRVDEGLFRKVTDFAREAGISRGAVLRQLTKKRFECEEMLESLSPVEANLAESLAPVRDSFAEPLTPVKESFAESRAPSVPVEKPVALSLAERRAAVGVTDFYDAKDPDWTWGADGRPYRKSLV